MDIISKIVAVLEANKAAHWQFKESYEEQGNRELAERAFGEWLAFDLALTLLKDGKSAEEHYEIWFGGEAAQNV